MQYNFDKLMERRGTNSIKWDHQDSFGVTSGLLPFWIADSDYATLPEICDAVKKRADFEVFGYTAYDEKAKQATCQWFETRHSWRVQPKEVLPSTGVVTSICFAMLAVTQPQDKVLVFTPVYDPFYRIIQSNHRTLVECPLTYTGNSYYMDFDKLENELKHGVKIVLLCNPHNPVGRVWTKEEMQQVANLCEKYGAYLLSDEIHADLELFGNKYHSAGRLQNIQDKLVVFTAPSKTFNIAGLASSNIMVPDAGLREKVENEMERLFIHGPNDLASPVGYAAYTHGHSWVDQQNAYLTQNAEYVQQYCTQHMPGVEVTKIEGTYLMWLNFNCLGYTSKQLSEILAQEYGIALGIGSNYGAQGDGFMRLNLACPLSMLEQGMQQLGKMYTAKEK